MRDRPPPPSAAGRPPSLVGLVALFALLMASGCAAGPRPAGAPAREDRPLSSVAEAQASLDDAERRLLSSPAAQASGQPADRPALPGAGAATSPGPSSTLPAGTAAPARPSPPPPPPAPAAAESKRRGEPSVASGGDDGVEERASRPCDVACRALGSMRRAAEAICRMTSPGDERCASARKRVADGESRVERCSCPAEPAPPT